jgi:hypothetical protein
MLRLGYMSCETLCKLSISVVCWSCRISKTEGDEARLQFGHLSRVQPLVNPLRSGVVLVCLATCRALPVGETHVVHDSRDRRDPAHSRLCLRTRTLPLIHRPLPCTDGGCGCLRTPCPRQTGKYVPEGRRLASSLVDASKDASIAALSLLVPQASLTRTQARLAILANLPEPIPRRSHHPAARTLSWPCCQRQSREQILTTQPEE